MNRLGKHLAIWGSVLQLGLVVGFVVTLVGMVRAFNDLSQSDAAQHPETLAAGIATSFHVFAIAFPAAIVGGLVTLAALFGCRYRAPWLHSVLCVLSIFWLATSPLLGLAMIAYLVLDRKSFFRTPESPFAKSAPGELSEPAA